MKDFSVTQASAFCRQHFFSLLSASLIFIVFYTLFIKASRIILFKYLFPDTLAPLLSPAAMFGIGCSRSLLHWPIELIAPFIITILEVVFLTITSLTLLAYALAEFQSKKIRLAQALPSVNMLMRALGITLGLSIIFYVTFFCLGLFCNVLSSEIAGVLGLLSGFFLPLIVFVISMPIFGYVGGMSMIRIVDSKKGSPQYSYKAKGVLATAYCILSLIIAGMYFAFFIILAQPELTGLSAEWVRILRMLLLREIVFSGIVISSLIITSLLTAYLYQHARHSKA